MRTVPNYPPTTDEDGENGTTPYPKMSFNPPVTDETTEVDVLSRVLLSFLPKRKGGGGTFKSSYDQDGLQDTTSYGGRRSFRRDWSRQIERKISGGEVWGRL